MISDLDYWLKKFRKNCLENLFDISYAGDSSHFFIDFGLTYFKLQIQKIERFPNKTDLSLP